MEKNRKNVDQRREPLHPSSIDEPGGDVGGDHRFFMVLRYLSDETVLELLVQDFWTIVQKAGEERVFGIVWKLYILKVGQQLVGEVVDPFGDVV